MSNDQPELAALIPGLTRSTITDDERSALYHAAMSGHQLPLGVRRWKQRTHREYHWKTMTTAEIMAAKPEQLASTVIDGLECPGCGHEIPLAEPGPLACDGCGNVYLVPDAKP